MRARWLAVVVLATACASSREGSQSSSSNGAGSASAGPPVMPASATPEQATSVKDKITGSDSEILKRLGGKYLCDQRVYPRGGGAHISAWEWAFPMEPAALANAVARELPGSLREELSFGYKNEAGAPDVVVSVDGAERSHLGCDKIPEGTKSTLVASRR